MLAGRRADDSNPRGEPYRPGLPNGSRLAAAVAMTMGARINPMR